MCGRMGRTRRRVEGAESVPLSEFRWPSEERWQVSVVAAFVGEFDDRHGHKILWYGECDQINDVDAFHSADDYFVRQRWVNDELSADADEETALWFNHSAAVMKLLADFMSSSARDEEEAVLSWVNGLLCLASSVQLSGGNLSRNFLMRTVGIMIDWNPWRQPPILPSLSTGGSHELVPRHDGNWDHLCMSLVISANALMQQAGDLGREVILLLTPTLDDVLGTIRQQLKRIMYCCLFVCGKIADTSGDAMALEKRFEMKKAREKITKRAAMVKKAGGKVNPDGSMGEGGGGGGGDDDGTAGMPGVVQDDKDVASDAMRDRASSARSSIASSCTALDGMTINLPTSKRLRDMNLVNALGASSFLIPRTWIHDAREYMSVARAEEYQRWSQCRYPCFLTFVASESAEYIMVVRRAMLLGLSVGLYTPYGVFLHCVLSSYLALLGTHDCHAALGGGSHPAWFVPLAALQTGDEDGEGSDGGGWNTDHIQSSVFCFSDAIMASESFGLADVLIDCDGRIILPAHKSVLIGDQSFVLERLLTDIDRVEVEELSAVICYARNQCQRVLIDGSATQRSRMATKELSRVVLRKIIDLNTRCISSALDVIKANPLKTSAKMLCERVGYKPTAQSALFLEALVRRMVPDLTFAVEIDTDCRCK